MFEELHGENSFAHYLTVLAAAEIIQSAELGSFELLGPGDNDLVVYKADAVSVTATSGGDWNLGEGEEKCGCDSEDSKAEDAEKTITDARETAPEQLGSDPQLNEPCGVDSIVPGDPHCLRAWPA